MADAYQMARAGQNSGKRSFRLPDGFERRVAWIADAERWISSLPRITAELCDSWQLSELEPLPGGATACVFAAVRSDGLPVVLKISPPSHPIAGEALALGVWRGEAAPRLLAADPVMRAVLVERMTPGTTPKHVPPEEAADLLRHLEAAAPARLPELREVVVRRIDDAHRHRGAGHRPQIPAGLLEHAETLAASLLAEQHTELVHGDFQARNIVSCARRGLAVIDASHAARGDCAYDAALFVVGENGPAKIGEGISVFAETCGLDADRIRSWSGVLAACEAYACDSDRRARELAVYAEELLAGCPV